MRIGGVDSHWSRPFSHIPVLRDLNLDLDLGSSHAVYRRVSLIDLYIHTKFRCEKICVDGKTYK